MPRKINSNYLEGTTSHTAVANTRRIQRGGLRWFLRALDSALRAAGQKGYRICLGRASGRLLISEIVLAADVRSNQRNGNEIE